MQNISYKAMLFLIGKSSDLVKCSCMADIINIGCLKKLLNVQFRMCNIQSFAGIFLSMYGIIMLPI